MTYSPLTIDNSDGASDDESDSAEFPAIELSVEELTRLVESMKNDASPFAKPDQRKRQRASLHARATIIPLRESCHPGSLAILVRDVSPAGLGFLYERPMNLDEQFAGWFCPEFEIRRRWCCVRSLAGNPWLRSLWNWSQICANSAGRRHPSIAYRGRNHRATSHARSASFKGVLGLGHGQCWQAFSAFHFSR